MRNPTILLVLWLVPIVAVAWSALRRPQQAGFLTGVALGVVVEPASLGLYSLYAHAGDIHWLSWPYFLLGMVGLVLEMFHTSLSYNIATAIDFIPKGVVIEGGTLLVKMFLVDALIWSLIYGTIGTLIDRFLGRRHTLKHQTE